MEIETPLISCKWDDERGNKVCSFGQHIEKALEDNDKPIEESELVHDVDKMSLRNPFEYSENGEETFVLWGDEVTCDVDHSDNESILSCDNEI